jgi:hypothetical protein
MNSEVFLQWIPVEGQVEQLSDDSIRKLCCLRNTDVFTYLSIYLLTNLVPILMYIYGWLLKLIYGYLLALMSDDLL